VRLYCATGNPGKLREFQAMAGGSLELAMVPGFREIRAPEETGATFAENAALKAAYYGRHVRGLLFAEDSGLEVDALGGDPGVRSARFSGAGDEANNRLLIEKLNGIAERGARYVCVIALVEDAKLVGTFRGTVEGEIIDEARGSGGFGYDPHFYYPPLGKTFAELPLEEKNQRSHRSRAFEQLLEWLRSFTAAASPAP
jgi:XTP/dITP diphosphohydrolase